ncbi:MAG: ATP-dependent zinc metalloprotease FtsH [Chloroherpetonaceae bacterium]|nr:ATP-dependent zinc metalloprotease FtsH [Chloroherpetonaceae bacterium]MCS7210717.1 ATP-dependent zinc metalloprotease FtsH [Chloroherpetonaceae bacterium]MDW8020111.1 ATP-dependent zinc metalloprotease FtsH [Chloroherpetonaceae bacterium]
MAENPFVKNRESGRPKNIRERFKPVRGDESPFANLNSNGDPDENFKRTFRVLLYAFAMIFLFFFLQRLFTSSEPTAPEISYNEFRRLLGLSLIKEAIVEKRDGGAVLTGILSKYETVELADNRGEKKIDRFIVKLPEFDRAMADELVEKHIKIKFEQREDGSLLQFLMVFGPWILLGVIYFVIIRRLTAQNGLTRNVFNFGKSRAKMITEFDTKVTFADVAGCDEAKAELREIVEFLREPEKFQRLGAKIPKGVLLLGPPGTGKTLLAKAVAGEAGVPFFSMSGADFVEMFVGVGASRVRDLFEQAKQHAPCIVFIDEIDAVGRSRGAGLGGGHDEREQTLNQLLVEMDGFGTNDNVILIAATNRPDVLDTALLRPGRFDRQIVVDKPDVRGREAILRIHTRKVPLAPDVNLQVIAQGTPGFAGADLANLVNEASLFAARANRNVVTMQDLEDARDKVLMGPERKSIYISPREKEITSYHESGHVLVAKFTEGADPVHKVTIIPRGRALGLTSYLPLEDKHTYSRQYILAMITYALGGRAAEEIVFSEISTGAGNDIERATELARKMVCEWGMSERLGPLNYGTKHQEVFLGRDFGRVRDYSEETAVAIDSEVRHIVSECMANARRILTEHIDILHRLAKALIERETLSASEIDRVIAGETLAPVQ